MYRTSSLFYAWSAAVALPPPKKFQPDIVDNIIDSFGLFISVRDFSDDVANAESRTNDEWFANKFFAVNFNHHLPVLAAIDKALQCASSPDWAHRRSCFVSASVKSPSTY